MNIGIRDGLVIESLRLIGFATDGDDELAVHVALTFFVMQKLTGLDEIDDLREQLKEGIERIIATLEAMT